ncbi:hypothetical protein FO519_008010 [Halicephalobus sp. NKZ332]|nr:hypothetical protein FO519_008010 [Halicephalobus sp. NKZ332]
MTHAPGNGIEDLYRSVILDVISQCREAFIDENVDVEILQQIQKSWEEKVNESEAVDLNPKTHTMPTSRPAPKMPVPGKPGPSGIQTYQESGPSTSDSQQMSHFNPAEYFTSNVNLIQQLPYSHNAGIPQFVLPGGQQISGNVMVMPVSIDGNVVQLTPEQLKNVHFLSQVDGNSDFEGLDLKRKPSDYRVNLDLKKGEMVIRKKKTKKDSDGDHVRVLTKELKKLNSEPDDDEKRKKLLEMLPQVDGGPTMSDSSSESDEDEDEHISRIVERIDEKAEADEDDGGDEEPLNSADDQSDDEDLDTLFESSNIIVCQFEKVNRARTKWKFTLKDGIMHLNGKDYCFQKCTGEAEW